MLKSITTQQHIKRAVYQGGWCWSKCINLLDMSLPDPANWGWKKDGLKWTPLWTDIDEASKALRELIKCGCKKCRLGWCKCKIARLKCTALCACDESCSND